MRRRRRGERRRGERRGEGGTTTTNKQTNNSNALYISETHKTSYSGWTQRELSAFVWRHTRARITNTMICPPWFMPSSASCLLPNNNQQVERKKKKEKKKKKKGEGKKKKKKVLFPCFFLLPFVPTWLFPFWDNCICCLSTTPFKQLRHSGKQTKQCRRHLQRPKCSSFK